MTDAELLAKAVKFVAGPVPVVNGWIVDDDDLDGRSPIVAVKKVCGRWQIHESGLVLSRDSESESGADWRYFPSFTAVTFATPSDAFAYLAEWKAKERERAAKSPHMKRWKDREKGETS